MTQKRHTPEAPEQATLLRDANLRILAKDLDPDRLQAELTERFAATC